MNHVAAPIKVLLVEDHEMVAVAFRSMLEVTGGFEIVGIAKTCAEGVSMAGYLRPDVAVVDFRLPDGEAADWLPRLFAAHPDVRVLIVTGWASRRTVSRSAEAGAHGVLSKSDKVEDLVGAVRRIAAGEVLIDPEVARPGHHDARDDDPEQVLSHREVEVLHLLGGGATTSEVAAKLGLSINTVRNHITGILAKLGTHTRLEAVTEAMRLGIISSPDSVR